MSYENNNNFGGGVKPDPTVEKSLKYIAQHLSFKVKDEMKEVVAPIAEGINRIAKNIETLAKQSGEAHANK